MVRLILLFLAIAFSGFAQESYIDSVISTTQVTATNINASGLTLSGTATVRGGPLGVSGTVSATRVLVGRSLSETTPDLSFGIDTDTGVAALGNNTLNLVTGGTTRLSLQTTRAGFFTGANVTSASFHVSGSAMVNGNLVAGCGNTSSSVTGMEICGGVSASGVISATRFVGDGSGLTGVAGTGPVAWTSLTNVPTSIAEVSNSGSVSVTNLLVSSSASIINLSATNIIGGTISGTAFTGYANGLLINPISATVSQPLLNMFGPMKTLTQLRPVTCDGQHHPENIYLREQVMRTSSAANPLNIANGPPGATCVWGMNVAVGAVPYVTVTTPGSGYPSNTTITVTGSGCTGQVVSATVVGGQIASVSMTSIGSGCTQTYPTITISGTGGSGASITAVIDHPLYLFDYTMWHDVANNVFAINSSELNQIANRWGQQTDTVTQTAIITVGYPAFAHDDVELSSVGQQKKTRLLAHCPGCMMVNPTVSLTADPGNFVIQCRDSPNVTIANPYVRIPTTASTNGRDGIHLTTGCSNAIITNPDVQSVDDGLGVTIEDGGARNRTQENVQVYGGTLRSSDHGALKLYTGNGAYGKIDGFKMFGTHLGSWSNHRSGNCGSILQEDGEIKNFVFEGVTCDGTLSEGNGGSSLFTISGSDSCGVHDGDLGNFKINNVPYRGLERDSGVCRVRSNGMEIGPYISETVIGVASATSAGISGTGVMRVGVSPSSVLSNVCVNTFCYAKLTGMQLDYNNTNGLVTQVSASGGFLLMQVANITASTTEISSTGTVTIVSRSGIGLYDRGSYGSIDANLKIIDPAQTGVQYTTANGKSYVASATVAINDRLMQVIISPTSFASLANLGAESTASGYASIVSFTDPSRNVTLGKIMSVVTNTTPPYMIVRTVTSTALTSATDQYNAGAVNVSGTASTGATLSTIYIPTDNTLLNPTLVSASVGSGFVISAGMGINLINPTCHDTAVNLCASESTVGNVSGSFLTGARSSGQNNRDHQTYSYPNARHAAQFLNWGSNPDFITFLALDQVSASQAKLNSGTVIGAWVVSSLSTTSVVTPSSFANVSVTSNVSVTGNISANKIIGDGSLLSNVAASALSAGPLGAIQISGPASATIAASGTSFNSSTQDMTFPTNLYATAKVSGTNVMATASGSCSAASFQVTAANVGLDRPASNVLGLCAGGTEGARVTINGISATAVRSTGTISASDIIQVGSTTTIACGSSIPGALRYNNVSDTLQVCTSVGWKSLTSTTAP